MEPDGFATLRAGEKEANKKIVKVGDCEVDLEEVVRDLRGVEDIATDIIKEMGERRVKQWKPKLNILAHASDIAEWDSVLLNRYHPLYTSIPSTPTIMEESNQAKLSLQDTCKGLFKQLTFARDLLEFAIKVLRTE